MPSPLQYAANRLTQSVETVRPSVSEHSVWEPYPRDTDSERNTSGRAENQTEAPIPSVPQGHARSSMNALRHGLTARVVVLPTEDMAAYRAFSKEIVDSLDPQTPVERQFAQTVADNQWRINRIRSIEDGMLGMGHYEEAGNFNTDHPEFHSAMTAARAFRDGSKAFVNLSIYEQRLHRTMKEALRQLKELQTERRELRKIEMDDAIRVRKAQEMKGLSFDPAEFGFVYASAEIARESARRDSLQDALLAEEAGFKLTEYAAFCETRKTASTNPR
jgi:hypothetical protein